LIKKRKLLASQSRVISKVKKSMPTISPGQDFQVELTNTAETSPKPHFYFTSAIEGDDFHSKRLKISKTGGPFPKELLLTSVLMCF
jgi:hypothetical protein